MSHVGTIREVKADIEQLEHSGVSVELSWTPGHSDIRGNEYADQLAKEAAQEAKGKEDLPEVITIGDVKAAARKTGSTKWQGMWKKAESGRHLFMFRPEVNHKVKHKFQSVQGEKIVSQLRTGYVRLHEYLNKINVVQSNLCQCGQIESVYHYLLDCPLYEDAREQMRRNLFESCGLTQLDLSILLDASKDDHYIDYRSTILTELETYVEATSRFATRKPNQ